MPEAPRKMTLAGVYLFCGVVDFYFLMFHHILSFHLARRSRRYTNCGECFGTCALVCNLSANEGHGSVGSDIP